MNQIEVMKMALEYIERHAIIDGIPVRTALRQAIEHIETAEFHSAEYWQGHDNAVNGVAMRWEEALTRPIPSPGVMNEPLESLYRRTETLRQAIEAADTPAYTTGHCKEKAKPGGCQLHNLQCSYPACDRKKAAPPAPAEQAERDVPETNFGNMEPAFKYAVTQAMIDRAAPTAPAQPLTNQEIYTAYIEAVHQPIRPRDERIVIAFARAIEQAHGIGEQR